jgi:ligand-binding sensor domain-containing protein
MNAHLVPASRWNWRPSCASVLSLLICACFSVASWAQHSTTARDEAAPISPPVVAPQISAYVREVFQDRDGVFWFGTNGDGVCRYDGAALAYFGMPQGFGGWAVRGIVQDSDGAMWFATDGGVSCYESGVFTNYTVANGLSDDSVWSMMLDKSGTIWVGTHEGVCRFDGESFVPFALPRVEVENPTSRFTPKVVFAMFEDHAGNLWFGTDGEGAHRYDGKSFTSYTTRDGLAGNQVRSICGDRRGRIWLGTNGGGVSCYDGSAYRNFSAKDGLNNDRVYEILGDRAGNMWFSTLGAGVCRYDGKSFTAFGVDQGLWNPSPSIDPANIHVQEFLEDKDGVIWLGCSGGLFRFDGKSFVNVTRDGPWPVPALESTPAKVATRPEVAVSLEVLKERSEYAALDKQAVEALARCAEVRWPLE